MSTYSHRVRLSDPAALVVKTVTGGAGGGDPEHMIVNPNRSDLEAALLCRRAALCRVVNNSEDRQAGGQFKNQNVDPRQVARQAIFDRK